MSEIGTGELLGQDVMDSGAGHRHVRQLDPMAAPREMPGGLDGDPLFIVTPLGHGRAVAQDQVVQRLPSGAEHSRRRRSSQRRLSWPLPGAASRRCQQEGHEKSSHDVHGVSTTRKLRWMCGPSQGCHPRQRRRGHPTRVPANDRGLSGGTAKYAVSVR